MRFRIRPSMGWLCVTLFSVALPCAHAHAQRRGVEPTQRRAVSPLGRSGVGQAAYQRSAARSQAMPPFGHGQRRTPPTFPTYKGPSRKPTIGRYGQSQMSFRGTQGTARGQAPKPTDPPADWRKFVLGDKKPPIRPKGQSYPGSRFPMNLQGSRGTARGQAPKPKDPPADWRDFTLGHKKPPVRPKGQTSQPSRFPMNLRGSQGTARGHAPKPTDPPGDWRKFVLGDKKPPIRPKGQTSQASRLPLNLQGRPSSSQPRPTRGDRIDDILPPYVHPPRHVVGFPPPRK